MENSKEYLRNRSAITEGDVVFIDLNNLMMYTKLVQLETLYEFVDNNNPEQYGMLNTLKFEIRAIMKELETQEDNNTLNY